VARRKENPLRKLARLLRELKENSIALGTWGQPVDETDGPAMSADLVKESTSALRALGMSASDAKAKIAAVTTPCATVQDVITAVFKQS
jgi:Holliday junction resolvasome RuvABC DNA-binding subunit